jgi:hypothetical protein
MSGEPPIPTGQVVLFVNDSTTDRPSLQGARHQRRVDWPQLGTRPTQDGQEDTHAAKYADPSVQARGNPLRLRSAALAAYTALKDEERRESGEEVQVIHPHTPCCAVGPKPNFSQPVKQRMDQ